jgi:hypothetical protein
MRLISWFEASEIGHLLDRERLGQHRPPLDGTLDGLIVGIGHVELAACLVVRHRAIRAARAQVSPRPLRRRVERASYVGEFGGGRDLGDAVEHPTRADRRELRPIPHEHELRPGLLDEAGEVRESAGIGHPGLVQIDRRVLPDDDPAVVRSRSECVHAERAAGQRWAIGPELLGGGPRHRDPDRFTASELLRPRCRVNHNTLPGARWADQNRGALGASDPLQCHGLLSAELADDTVADFALGEFTRGIPHLPVRRDREVRDVSLDCLLHRTDRERSQPAALERHHTPLPDHLARESDRLGRGQHADGLLEDHGTELALSERRRALGQPLLDTLDQRPLRTRVLSAREQPLRLLAGEPVALALLRPCCHQVGLGGRGLRFPVCELQAL